MGFAVLFFREDVARHVGTRTAEGKHYSLIWVNIHQSFNK